ncbi:Hypothetical protein R9X50_00506700 [Acrodontium crateriforme]|uniref:NADP-dependent oxidoreductase domain-containing protein n=1 Tax=Acrodontium crateriforme TaxID=150365 RepID=A0AAQ3M781_9PEZI|nr:Hypothetical protein R9X50_00506700 [Acrodontium crateriforme]
MSLPKTFSLRVANGKTVEIPSVGYGTWASGENSWAKDAVAEALKAGYRHLDCAWMYGVDGAVGDAIRESGIPRDEIFITSKFWPNFAHPNNVELALDMILKNMGLEYIDLFLAHWPLVFKNLPREKLERAFTGPNSSDEDKALPAEENGKRPLELEFCPFNIAKQKGATGSYVPTWKAMQETVRKGKAKAVGLSNFSITEIKELLPHQRDVPISCNQVEVHPWLPQRELIEFAKQEQILITCYSPFAGQKKDGATLLKDQQVLKLAEKNKMDVGQMLQSWAVQRGTVPLGKSATAARIKSNLDVRRLSVEDMRALDSLAIPNEEGRTINPSEGWGISLFQN